MTDIVATREAVIRLTAVPLPDLEKFRVCDACLSHILEHTFHDEDCTVIES